ncbi:MAG: hypothetical protein KF900_01260 [Bacteroidetes bacterium]|nr:hypothetical protein [Bacteroidota bacterium]
MKRVSILILTFILTGFSVRAQNPTYNDLVSVIYAKLPNADVSGKILSFVSWSAADAASRDVNKEFDRVGTIYQLAKLKNGNKGTIVISCNIDGGSTATIAFSKDGINFALKINKSDFNFLSNVTSNKNIVYDNTGTKVFENLTQQQVFMSYNSLITR